MVSYVAGSVAFCIKPATACQGSASLRLTLSRLVRMIAGILGAGIVPRWPLLFPALRKACAFNHTVAAADCFSFHGQWPADEREQFGVDMRIVPQFVDQNEERRLMDEIDPYLRRLRYEFDHWDDAIHGYRETERKHWQPANRAILDRIATDAFNGNAMPYVHVLDLAEEGVIKPHVDSVRFCGSTIAGISLLSDSVMRLVRTNDEEQTNEEYRQLFSQHRDAKYWADVLLPRCSLYVMRDTARYKFTHEILPNAESVFRQREIRKTRRVSIICRNEPE